MKTKTKRKLTDAALAVGATVRGALILNQDMIGRWLVVDPAELWAMGREGFNEDPDTSEIDVDPDLGWRSKLVSGLTCPACTGFWISAITVGTYTVARRSDRGLRAWRTVTGILTLSTVTTEIVKRV